MGQVLKKLNENSPAEQGQGPSKKPKPTQHAARASAKSSKSFVTQDSDEDQQSSEDGSPVRVRHQARIARIAHGIKTVPYGLKSGPIRETTWDSEDSEDDDGPPALVEDEPSFLVNGKPLISMGSKVDPVVLEESDYATSAPGTKHPIMVNHRVYTTSPQDWISRTITTILVDKTVWCSLSRDDQHMIRAMATIEFYENPDDRGKQLVWHITPDDQAIDRKLLYAVKTAMSEEVLDRATRLLRMIWNSRELGAQHENEEDLRLTIIESGKRLRLYPWYDDQMPMADFNKPEYNIYGPGPLESKRWQARHFLDTQADFEMTAPPESAVQWQPLSVPA
jgi:hypothetical protein